MAGLVGLAKFKKTTKRGFDKAVKSLSNYESKIIDQGYADQNVLASRVHLNIINTFSERPFKDENFHIWLDGEIYNENGIYSETEAYNLILKKYANGGDFSDLNGMFSIVIYDSINKKISIITDRLGLRRLFYYYRNDTLIWSSELKAFKYLEDCELSIRKESLHDFLRLGHLIDDNTWFNEVKVVTPATTIAFDFKKAELKKEYYWSWNEIEKDYGVNIDDAISHASFLFRKAVEKRSIGDTFISLSGGLDSRAILAYSKPQQITYTYGNPDSSDVRIADKSAKINGSSHHFYEITSENWLNGRIEGVWNNDGMSSLLHMHFAPFHEKIRELGKINLNGFLGDLVFGGSYLKLGHFDKKINYNLAKSKFGQGISQKFLEEEYFGVNSSDPYFIYNRGIRFTMMGSIESSRFMEHRKPFLDYDLIDFLYTIPEKEKYLSKFYNRFLVHEKPKYFKDIEWQRTGCKVSSNQFNTAVQLGIKQALKLLSKISETEIYDFSNYKIFLRSAEFKDLYSKLINENSIYKEYIEVDYKGLLDKTLSSKRKSVNEVGNLMTLELWLQQFFLDKFRE